MNPFLSKISQNAEAGFAAEIAVRSLLYEVSVSPKPGLVDRFDCGAHNDMDFFTYMASSAALAEYFRSAFQVGRSLSDHVPEDVFPALQELGLCAEQYMYAATKGVNTHKGLIFTLGLFCGGLGYLSDEKACRNETDLLQICSKMVLPTMTQNFLKLQNSPGTTAGERLYALYGQKGVRGEAAAGYPSIRNYGLPTLRSKLAQGYSINDAGIFVLLKLLCYVEDSNIFSRGGVEAQIRMKQRARKILEEESLDMTEMVQFNSYCIEKHISPGGCADLLAATFFLHFYFDQ